MIQVLKWLFGLMQKHHVHLCSQVRGSVTLKGKPIAGIEIKRSLSYADEEQIDITKTDEQGSFAFEEKSIRSRLPGNILHQPVVRQIVYLKYEGEHYVLWYANQRGIEPIPGYTARLLQLNAELTTEEQVYEIENHDSLLHPYGVTSICRWPQE